MLRWYDAARRDLPWRESTGFYRVWISEAMLQQTRVEAVIPCYLRFLARFPSVEDLARAPEDDVLTAWSGLGYYSRARNLHRAAKKMAAEGLPSTYEGVLALPGAGPYTAAAIASIALNLPRAAVDGNVVRALSRLTNDASDTASLAARRAFAAEAAALLDPERPGDFNQAMMELGATVCLPRAPRCGACPITEFCAARAAGTERELPVKRKKPPPRRAPLDLILLEDALVEDGTRIFLVQRASSERRLAGFRELPDKSLFPHLPAGKLCEFRHSIANDRFAVTIWRASVPEKGVPEAALPPGKWFAATELHRIPLTTVTKKALKASRQIQIA